MTVKRKVNRRRENNFEEMLQENVRKVNENQAISKGCQTLK